MLRARLAERLQDLLLDNDALEDFLRQLSALAAEFAAAETGRPVLCSVRLARRRQLKVVAGSSPEALILDSLQDCMSEGPGLEAGQAGLAVLVPDTTMDPTVEALPAGRRPAREPQHSRRDAAGGSGRNGHPRPSRRRPPRRSTTAPWPPARRSRSAPPR